MIVICPLRRVESTREVSEWNPNLPSVAEERLQNDLVCEHHSSLLAVARETGQRDRRKNFESSPPCLFSCSLAHILRFVKGISGCSFFPQSESTTVAICFASMRPQLVVPLGDITSHSLLVEHYNIVPVLVGFPRFNPRMPSASRSFSPCHFVARASATRECRMPRVPPLRGWRIGGDPFSSASSVPFLFFPERG